MNFFEHQDRARQNTQYLIGLYVLSIGVMIVAIYITTLFLLRMAPRIWWHGELFLSVVCVTTIAIALASLYKIFGLRAGGRAIAQELGGRLLISERANEKERQLLNIVEEMAIASGISVPEVYLLDSEMGINAFAAGFTANNAVIGVTRGTLQHLNRDELQGVIGHEFSHILNGDMRLNLRLIGLLHGILFIYFTGRVLWHFRSDSREDKGLPLWAFGLALMLIGGIGFLCGTLIKAAVSRQREFLADASAVQFTRNPDGIAGVLEKLQNMDSRVIAPSAEAASHMFFGNALNPSFWEDMLATHPPLDERIRRVRGVKIRNPNSPTATRHQRQPHAQESLVMGLAGGATTKVTAEQVVNQVGTVAPEHFAHAQALLSQLPESLRLAVREQQSATAIVLALALETENPAIRERQISWLREVQPVDLVDKILAFNSEVSQLNSKLRLPLLDLTIPALRQGSATDCKRLCKCIHGLVIVNRNLSLWYFVLQLVLWHRLQPCINPTASISVEFTSMEQIWPDSIQVLSVLARVGHSQADAAAYAFRCGVFRLPGAGNKEISDALVESSFADVKRSIERLRLASPKIKQAIVDACAHTVLVDNKVTPQEADLLRAIAMTLDCPIPPFLSPQRNASAKKQSSSTS